MNADDLLAALEFPANARVDRRVPKSMLLEHAAPTAGDRRRINEGIEEIRWVAALKPASIGVAAWRDEAREYLEIAVLRVALRPEAKLPRVLELLHRAIPYPVVAVTQLRGPAHLSLGHARWSQAEAGKSVLDGELVSAPSPAASEPYAAAFAEAMSLSRQPRTSLFELYQGWIDTLHALEAARRTGSFVMADGPQARAARREALAELARLEAEISRLRSAAAVEKQLARQVQHNLELQRLQAARSGALARL